CPLARPLDLHGDDGIERGIVLGHSLEIEVQELEAPDLLPANVGGQLFGGAERSREHGSLPYRPLLMEISISSAVRKPSAFVSSTEITVQGIAELRQCSVLVYSSAA